jgi:hypothetical protein
MKILLIKPPIHSCRVQIGRHAPIGLLYLAGELRNAGHEVEIFDALAYTAENRIVSADDAGPADRQKIARRPNGRGAAYADDGLSSGGRPAGRRCPMR